MNFDTSDQSFSITLGLSWVKPVVAWFKRYGGVIGLAIVLGISIYYFAIYLGNGLGLSYNDARSHLDIGRRVVEGLKPGLAQLGSVWLPLNHLLMIPLIWQDTLWHTGLAGAFWSMLAFVGTAVLITRYLKLLGVGWLGQLVGATIFIANLNVLYLQSTAMTELLLLFTMLAGCYYLLHYHQTDNVLYLIKAAFWIMLSTLVRYDGWFLLGVAGLLVIRQSWVHKSFKQAEGTTILFSTLAAIGIIGWFVWNQLIFHDALYFILGPFSAHAQQKIMAAAGALPTQGNMLLSLKVYLYALLYNVYTYPAILAIFGLVKFWLDRDLPRGSKWGIVALLSPLVFNIIALYLGFSVIYVQGISGDTWFNIRYGIMIIPLVAIAVGYLVDRARSYRLLLVLSLAMVLFFAFYSHDAVSIDDARVGSSQKNVSEVSGYLNTYAKNETGYILISAASHDAIIFSSGLPMKRFIHEGTGKYWDNATSYPDRFARWIVMRTYDDNDLTWKAVSQTEGFKYYHKVASYPFADVYELDETHLDGLNK